ncbi:uncharacterized protein LOC108907258 isoform X1 [Anoplophora glabripennis]|uniref:uncharacterized protein LOC108907258 isoform X1 n=1 Tax=Anoplophora glabripennis TaxID=217634 RepID=UPI000873A99B|nr:uncharacterized protein LOC108907258 isoform X1 [Anoplophora glabripennis]
MSQVRKSKKRPFADRVNKFIGEFPDLFYNGAIIICKVCERDLMCWDKRDCKRHVNSVQHKNKKNGVPLTTQFMFDLQLMFIACNIPLHILDKQPFRDFWNKYNPQLPLPSRAALCNYLPTAREDIVGKIKCLLKNTWLWLCVDETTDCKKNSIVNVIVRVLDSVKPTLPLLLVSKRLSECTGETVTRVVLETLEKFELSTSQVLIFVTDGAVTMGLVGRSLQEHGCRFVHITCKVHALNLVAETICQGFPKVDKLIANTKKVFLKSPKRLQVFRSQCPDIPEPPQPILTCWGTWLQAALYYAKYFQQIKAVIGQFNPKETVAIKECQTAFENSDIESDLQTIHSNYSSLHDAIGKLKNSALSFADSVQILDEVNRLLNTIDDAKNECVREKFASVLEEDAGFTRLRQICDGTVSECSDPLYEFKDHFKYACITSIDVEWSFSKYNHIFSPQRTSLAETTIETYLMLQSYYTASPVCFKTENEPSTSS